ncbi:hypothetical protein A1507_01565 [Methylomonas koyamae]|uniref:Uncharacterized protein n=1 Tax=Methylomonas koyamae TaxID=702114 RepID=A0A177N673_9GAMM|nr:hypothetical protein A1507_01565 [Methylomonas koyamae]
MMFSINPALKFPVGVIPAGAEIHRENRAPAYAGATISKGRANSAPYPVQRANAVCGGDGGAWEPDWRRAPFDRLRANAMQGPAC